MTQVSDPGPLWPSCLYLVLKNGTLMFYCFLIMSVNWWEICIFDSIDIFLYLQENDTLIPILTIRLELIDNRVAFRPPLDQNTSAVSVQELVHQWLDGFLARGRLVKMLGPKVIFYLSFCNVQQKCG